VEWVVDRKERNGYWIWEKNFGDEEEIWRLKKRDGLGK